jgi:hypothetical protein
VSVEHFQRRAEECRRLAIDARDASDKAFWLGLVECWQALEIQKTRQPIRDKPRTPRGRQSVLDNNERRHSRLDEIAEALRRLTHGQMLQLAESMWKVNSQGSGITESNLPNVLYRWSKSVQYRKLTFISAVVLKLDRRL